MSPYKAAREENRRFIDHYVECYVDCPTEKLIQRDTTGKYKKSPAGAGMPAEGTDLLAAAKSVGKPGRSNCGACHLDADKGTFEDAAMRLPDGVISPGGVGYDIN